MLDVAHTLGRIEGQNELILQEQGRAATSRKEMYGKVDDMRAEVADSNNKLTALTARVTTIEPHVNAMIGFRTQVGIAVVVVSAIITGAFHLVWAGVANFDKIRPAIRNLLGPS